ncbi:FHA domain-containing protein PS1-like isoform X2 [Lycium ferocissimum]|uniref:FHA domain-containing protein PS1-like isoform X2 n=1 Tax=Lycium ferocissimum TaxID=112874 RepID=UPI0028156C69|nr:FHA domain-containing protein PS1-like isoform X2 [Lycium ferocissimum]
MGDKQESLLKPNSQTEEEKKIPVFTVLKNGAILKNIFLLDNPTASVEESKQEFEEILVVGRHPDCNIVLEHPSISRFHLRIHSNPCSQSLSVIDLSSVHGSWISGNKIEPGVRVELKEGDKMKLGRSSREYMLHWIPISRAYDLENPFVAPLADAEPLEETEEKEHQDERGFALQNEDNDLVQGLDSTFSDMHLLPYVKSLTPSAPPMPEEMKSPFHFSDEEVNINPPEKIHGESELSLLQPAYEPDKENSTPRALLVSAESQTENADSSTPVRSQQRCLSIWSRRGKCSSVQIQTGRDRSIIEKVDIDTEVYSLNHEKVAMESVSNDPFSSGNKDGEEDAFTPDKENNAPSSVKSSRLADGQAKQSMFSSCVDENGEENFNLDKVDLTPNTHLRRSMKKMSSLEQIKHPKSLRSSPMKEISDPILHQAEGLEYNKKEKIGSSTMLSNMSNISEEIFTPDKGNMTPDNCSMRSKPFKKEDLIVKVLEEQKSVSVASRNKARSEITILKNRTDRVPLQPLLVNNPPKTNSKSPVPKVKLNANPIKCQEIMEACPYSDNNAREEKRRWTMVADTTSLLNKESRKALQLLEGLKGTCLIIPRIVLRELDCMKRRASFFRRATEAYAALEWIENCMVNAKSWVHVQSCVEETRPMAPTPPATAPPCLFSEENDIFPVGSVLSSPHWGLQAIVSPTAEDHILECALLFKRTNRNGQLVLLSNDLTIKIKAMAEGLNCETAEDFRESLVNPFSERFLWKDSSPRGSTWSCVDDFVLKEPYYLGPLKKTSTSGQAAKGLKLILLHNSHYRRNCSGNTVS